MRRVVDNGAVLENTDQNIAMVLTPSMDNNDKYSYKPLKIYSKISRYYKT